MNRQSDPDITWEAVKFLRDEIKRQYVTQAVIADKTGVQQPHLCHTLAGRTEPRLSTIVRIAKALGFDVDIVFTERSR